VPPIRQMSLGVSGGNVLARVDISRAIGGERVSMGLLTNQRFPFTLPDRIIFDCARAMNWSHGRPAAEEDAPDKIPDKELLRKGLHGRAARGPAEGLGSAG